MPDLGQMEFSHVGGSVALSIWMVASALTNVLLIATFVLVSWRPLAVNRSLVGSLAVATMISAYWFVLPDLRGDLRVGYYLWLAAFALGTFAARATVGERAVAAAVGARAAKRRLVTGGRVKYAGGRPRSFVPFVSARPPTCT